MQTLPVCPNAGGHRCGAMTAERPVHGSCKTSSGRAALVRAPSMSFPSMSDALDPTSFKHSTNKTKVELVSRLWYFVRVFFDPMTSFFFDRSGPTKWGQFPGTSTKPRPHVHEDSFANPENGHTSGASFWPRMWGHFFGQKAAREDGKNNHSKTSFSPRNGPNLNPANRTPRALPATPEKNLSETRCQQLAQQPHF